MQLETVGAVIMIGPGGSIRQEQLVHRAVQAAALDLVHTLQTQGIHPIVLAGPDLSWLPDSLPVIRDVDSGPFHFGQRLAGLVEKYNLSPVMYFGAGSAPLVDSQILGLMIGMLHGSQFRSGQIPTHIALTNNLHSSDWLGITHTSDALAIIRQAERDNSLAWMLQQEWDFDVRVLSSVRPASSMDLDTPADLAIVRQHPGCGPYLAAALDDPLLDRIPLERLIDIVIRDGSRLAIIGRVSPLAWQALSKATQCWIRVFSEERGMVASERLARGEVHSLIGRFVELLGPSAFFSELAQTVDAAIIDTRVLMAAAGQYPHDADRFASDLFLTDEIQNPWLREFTLAAAAAPIPILLGGHGVVAGGLYALTDIISARRRVTDSM
ncbi:MAG: hypothetical protein HY866_19780 [Chloroflexi bacterium]|nr:hypothetical protein [Chloroflexota bacterium]